METNRVRSAQKTQFTKNYIHSYRNASECELTPHSLALTIPTHTHVGICSQARGFQSIERERERKSNLNFDSDRNEFAGDVGRIEHESRSVFVFLWLIFHWLFGFFLNFIFNRTCTYLFGSLQCCCKGSRLTEILWLRWTNWWIITHCFLISLYFRFSLKIK